MGDNKLNNNWFFTEANVWNNLILTMQYKTFSKLEWNKQEGYAQCHESVTKMSFHCLLAVAFLFIQSHEL